MTILGCLSDLSIWSIKNIFIQMSRLILTTALFEGGGGASSKSDFAAFQKYSSQLRWRGGGSSAGLQVTPKSKYSKVSKRSCWMVYVGLSMGDLLPRGDSMEVPIKIVVRLLGSCRARSSGPNPRARVRSLNFGKLSILGDKNRGSQRRSQLTDYRER